MALRFNAWLEFLFASVAVTLSWTVFALSGARMFPSLAPEKDRLLSIAACTGIFLAFRASTGCMALLGDRISVLSGEPANNAVGKALFAFPAVLLVAFLVRWPRLTLAIHEMVQDLGGDAAAAWWRENKGHFDEDLNFFTRTVALLLFLQAFLLPIVVVSYGAASAGRALLGLAWPSPAEEEEEEEKGEEIPHDEWKLGGGPTEGKEGSRVNGAERANGNGRAAGDAKAPAGAARPRGVLKVPGFLRQGAADRARDASRKSVRFADAKE